MPYTATAAPAILPEEMTAPAMSGKTASDSAAEGLDQNSDAQGSDATLAQGARPKSGFQRRIDKLTRTIGDKDRVIELLLAERAARAQNGVQNGVVGNDDTAHAANAALSSADGKPNPDHFESQAEFLEALADWKLDQRAHQHQAQQYQQRVQQHHQAVTQQFLDRQDAYRNATPDYDDTLVDSDAPVSPAMADEIRGHEHGPALMYFLANNPEIAEHLSQLAPTALAREVGRLESQFIPAQDGPAADAPVDSPSPDAVAANISRAPRPPNPVSKSTRTAGKDPGEMNPSEYREWRRKQFPNL